MHISDSNEKKVADVSDKGNKMNLTITPSHNEDRYSHLLVTEVQIIGYLTRFFKHVNFV